MKKGKLMQAVWNDVVIAESNETVLLEGNHYFPPDSIKKEYFEISDLHTHCPWKGQASYYDIVVKGERNHGAAWYYPDPKPAAGEIKNYIGFWRGVEVKPAEKQTNNKKSMSSHYKKLYDENN